MKFRLCWQVISGNDWSGSAVCISSFGAWLFRASLQSVQKAVKLQSWQFIELTGERKMCQDATMLNLFLSAVLPLAALALIKVRQFNRKMRHAKAEANARPTMTLGAVHPG